MMLLKTTNLKEGKGNTENVPDQERENPSIIRVEDLEEVEVAVEEEGGKIDMMKSNLTTTNTTIVLKRLTLPLSEEDKRRTNSSVEDHQGNKIKMVKYAFLTVKMETPYSSEIFHIEHHGRT